MAVGQFVGVVILMVTLTNFQCSGDEDGPFLVECLDHNLVITVKLFSEATEPYIEAMGKFPIPRGGEAKCGYTYDVYKRLGIAVLRASYFSCYTENKNDRTFTFNFQLSMPGDGKEVYRITKTCSPPRWSHREITCEKNYIEVSVQTDLPWHMQSQRDAVMASVLPEVHEFATSVWQIMFLRKGKPAVTHSVAEAADQGYFLDVTPSRIVFRTAYGQAYSVTGRMSGLKIEDIRPVVFLRQGFRTTIVDLAASCTLDDYSYNDGTFIWRTLKMVSPIVSAYTGFQSKEMSIGVDGRRLDPKIAAERGLRLDVGSEIVTVSVPYGAKGGLRKTFVMDNVYHEFYAACLFYEHVFTTDGNSLESRLHYVRDMTTPFLVNTPFTTNSPPLYVNGLCMEKGIKFKINHQKFDFKSELGIGAYPLTQELAKARGYVMTNNSQSLTLDVPLFTVGYRYEDVSLEEFSATFEIVIRDAVSLKSVQSIAKTCRFPTTEMLVCSPNGTMTVVADLTKAKPSALPFKTTLLDKTCKPSQVDEKRALFKFSLNSCGTRFQVTNGFLIYENEIVFKEAFIPEKKPVITRDSAYRVILQCIYPVNGVNRLAIDRRFQSETSAKGTMEIQKPVKIPVTMAPKVRTTTRKVTTTTPILTVPTFAQATRMRKPVGIGMGWVVPSPSKRA